MVRMDTFVSNDDLRVTQLIQLPFVGDINFAILEEFIESLASVEDK